MRHRPGLQRTPEDRLAFLSLSGLAVASRITPGAGAPLADRAVPRPARSPLRRLGPGPGGPARRRPRCSQAGPSTRPVLVAANGSAASTCRRPCRDDDGRLVVPRAGRRARSSRSPAPSPSRCEATTTPWCDRPELFVPTLVAACTSVADAPPRREPVRVVTQGRVGGRSSTRSGASRCRSRRGRPRASPTAAGHARRGRPHRLQRPQHRPLATVVDVITSSSPSRRPRSRIDRALPPIGRHDHDRADPHPPGCWLGLACAATGRIGSRGKLHPHVARATAATSSGVIRMRSRKWYGSPSASRSQGGLARGRGGARRPARRRTAGAARTSSSRSAQAGLEVGAEAHQVIVGQDSHALVCA